MVELQGVKIGRAAIADAKHGVAPPLRAWRVRKNTPAEIRKSVGALSDERIWQQPTRILNSQVPNLRSKNMEPRTSL
jgi:hypothetical protein